MSTAEAAELKDVLNRVKTWPATLQITLAHKILESLDNAKAPAAAAPAKERGLTAAEIQGLLKTDRPPPGYETVECWIEYRMEKYGR
jgi:hypothetical protein